ncbi:MAG: hypothetical protein AAFU71_12405 [Cyanobacteria bacterium J06632_22]
MGVVVGVPPSCCLLERTAMSVVAIALLITLVTTAAFTLVGLTSAGRSVNLENYLVHRPSQGSTPKWQTSPQTATRLRAD